MGCLFIWVKFGNAFGLFCGFGFAFASQMALLFNITIQTHYILIATPDRQIKYIFTQKSFYLQGILNDINEQDISS